MALTFKVNGRDLSTYIRAAHGDGLEPASADAFDPQFTGSTAIGEGQSFVGNSLGNVAMSFPLILKAASTDALYQLIRDIRTDLAKGNTVEYRSGGATQSTFFDMESGKLEPQFEFWLDQNARCRAQLTIWRRPYGHTGTSRVIGTAAGTGMLNVLASGLVGDMDALAVVKTSSVPSSLPFPLSIFGVKAPVPSGWTPEVRAASIGSASSWIVSGFAATGRSLAGAAGRLASQAVGFGLGPSANYSLDKHWALGELRLPPVTYAGRYRVLMGAQTGVNRASGAVGEYVLAHDSAGLNDTQWAATKGNFGDFSEFGRATAMGASFGWALYDMGDLNIATSAASSVPKVALLFKTASGVYPASQTGFTPSYPFKVEGFYLIPTDHSAGVFAAATPWFTTASLAIESDAVRRTVSLTVGTAAAPAFKGFRGDFPTVPVPSGGARIVAIHSVSAANKETLLSGANSWYPAEPVNIEVRVRERFSYMR